MTGVTLFFFSKDEGTNEGKDLTLEELLIRQFGSLAEAPAPDAGHVHVLTDKELQRLETRALPGVFSQLEITTLAPEKVIDVKPAPKDEDGNDEEELKPPEELVPVKKTTLRHLGARNANKVKNRRKKKDRGKAERQSNEDSETNGCGMIAFL